ncbi:hypothetical protein ITP53_00380 [Nonomuraea sp. K274]|uniref:Uncharacterized protein n=1 Tax=Nonomuraea cypriaca TaxID=1187855 RepID=A0A931A360_9ACTN|nr:hypothetical protein [Nonomuraea cypriaca]MBF8184228.1 hypothetical protein [Nonomuraea cypriaca]
MHQERHQERRAAWAVLAPAVMLLLAGCGAAEPDPTAASAPTSPATTAPTSPVATAPSSTPPSSPSSASPAARKPADGRRLAACSDAKCEVEVSTGDVIRFNARAMRKAGFGDLKVKSIRENKIVYTLASGGATFTQPGPDDTANVNGISLTLVRTEGKRAVIRIGAPKRGEMSVTLGPDGSMQVTT